MHIYNPKFRYIYYLFLIFLLFESCNVSEQVIEPAKMPSNFPVKENIIGEVVTIQQFSQVIGYDFTLHSLKTSWQSDRFMFSSSLGRIYNYNEIKDLNDEVKLSLLRHIDFAYKLDLQYNFGNIFISNNKVGISEIQYPLQASLSDTRFRKVDLTDIMLKQILSGQLYIRDLYQNGQSFIDSNYATEMEEGDYLAIKFDSDNINDPYQKYGILRFVDDGINKVTIEVYVDK